MDKLFKFCWVLVAVLFTLPGVMGDEFFNEPMDSNPGWTISGGLWAFGVPTGGGSGNGDPTSGCTGSYVYGYNLNGDYEGNMPECHLDTPAIDCSGSSTAVELEFCRWLGIEDFNWDHAYVRISNDGGNVWHEVWGNGSYTIDDGVWTKVIYDISDWATGESDVRIRWTMGTSDDSNQYCGWNIDDVVVREFFSPPPCGPSGSQIVFEQLTDCDQTALSSQLDTNYSVVSEVADDFGFMVTLPSPITWVEWWGNYYGNPPYPGAATGFNISIYASQGSEPPNCLPLDPPLQTNFVPIADCNEARDCMDIQTYKYCASIDPFMPTPGEKYWISIQCVCDIWPQWGWRVSTAQQLCETGFKSDYFGYPYWTEGSSAFGAEHDTAFRLIVGFEDTPTPTETPLFSPTPTETPPQPTATPTPVYGDNCNIPIMFDVPDYLPFTDLYQTNCGRNNDHSETCLDEYDGGQDIIYKIMSLEDTDIVISLDVKGTSYTGIVLDDSCPPDDDCIWISRRVSGNHLSGCISLGSGPPDEVNYYIMIDTWPDPDCIPDFNLHVYECPPPTGTPDPLPNDICDNAIPIEMNSQITGNTCGSNNDYEPGCQSDDGGEIWYVLNLDHHCYGVHICLNADFDSVLDIVDNCNDLNSLWCDDDLGDQICSGSPYSCDWTYFLDSGLGPLEMPAGAYYIAVDGYDSECGNFCLDIWETETPLPITGPISLGILLLALGALLAGTSIPIYAGKRDIED